MTQAELVKMLDFFDSKGVWVLSMHAIYLYFNKESKHSIKVALNRHYNNGLIQRVAKGIYVNPRSNRKPANPLEMIATAIRDVGMFYLSLESVLSQHGLISQIPNRLTFVTSGRNGEFKTPYGVIEFTHTSRKAEELFDGCYFDESRKVFVAAKERAIDDAYRHNRSVDLLQEQAKKDML